LRSGLDGSHLLISKATKRLLAVHVWGSLRVMRIVRVERIAYSLTRKLNKRK